MCVYTVPAPYTGEDNWSYGIQTSIHYADKKTSKFNVLDGMVLYGIVEFNVPLHTV